MLSLVDYDFGAEARNRLAHTTTRGPDGAVAALETFYYALNNADLDALVQVWADDRLVQLNNPVGGIVRSRDAVADLYRRVFASGIGVQVRFTDAITYLSDETAVFAGREVGGYRGRGGERLPLTIRTTRIFAWSSCGGRWAQVHHHGSIDDAEALAAYQAAVRQVSR